MEHVDYPHEPGYLYDCPACEEECYCTIDDNGSLLSAPCVYCTVDE